MTVLAAALIVLATAAMFAPTVWILVDIRRTRQRREYIDKLTHQHAWYHARDTDVITCQLCGETRPYPIREGQES